MIPRDRRNVNARLRAKHRREKRRNRERQPGNKPFVFEYLRVPESMQTAVCRGCYERGEHRIATLLWMLVQGNDRVPVGSTCDAPGCAPQVVKLYTAGDVPPLHSKGVITRGNNGAPDRVRFTE